MSVNVFHSPLSQIEEKMRSLVIQHGIRLLKLRCFEAEIKARIRCVFCGEEGVTAAMGTRYHIRTCYGNCYYV